MKIYRATLETCAEAEGTVVAIDVLRAFTTAAFAFAAGADRILLVAGVNEAFALRDRHPAALLMGEVDGLPVPGFDFGNSPAELRGEDLSGMTLIQRTTAGTQAVVRARRAKLLLAAGLTNVGATVRYLQTQARGAVVLVATGGGALGGGEEDVACGDVIAAALKAEPLDLTAQLNRVRNSRWGRNFSDPDKFQFPADDLILSLQIDRFGFAMPVEREEELLVMRAERI